MLIARDGPLKGLLLHDLVALLVFHFGILVVGLYLYHLGRQADREKGGREEGASKLGPSRGAEWSGGGDATAAHELPSPGLRECQSRATWNCTGGAGLGAVHRRAPVSGSPNQT